MNLQESIRKVLREEYSPAGNEIIPNRIIVHKSNPMFRDNIMSEGLKAKAGECYRIYVGYGTKCKPAIFATNSTNKRAWFDSTYDDDIWFIDTTKISDVKWFKDRHFESTKKHIVTFQDIPPEALTLKYEGTGRSGDLLEESIRRILREDISNRAQEKLNQVLKSQGVVSASKVVGGINNLVKKLGLDMDDLKTQEMLSKSFIYHTNIEDVDILHLEINRDRPDKVRIKIHFNTNNPASNMESWLVRTLCDEMNKFFPFKTAPYWEPAFAGRGVTVILYPEQLVNGDDEDI